MVERRGRESLNEEAEWTIVWWSAVRIFRTVMDTWCEMNLSIVAVDGAVFV